MNVAFKQRLNSERATVGHHCARIDYCQNVLQVTKPTLDFS